MIKDIFTKETADKFPLSFARFYKDNLLEFNIFGEPIVSSALTYEVLENYFDSYKVYFMVEVYPDLPDNGKEACYGWCVYLSSGEEPVVDDHGIFEASRGSAKEKAILGSLSLLEEILKNENNTR